MASIRSVAAYDNSAFSLAAIFSARIAGNLSHGDLQVGATTFVDVVNIAVSSFQFPSIYHFGGSGLGFDAANGRITAGTVNAIVGTSGRFSDPIASQTVAFSITGLNITASAIAAARADAAKDAALTAAIFRGNDTFSLSVAEDIAYGHGSNDTMLGRGGNDELYGNAGNDTLDGGSGNDQLTGGTGKDYFIFEAYGFDPSVGAETQDTITDFRRAQGDLIALKFGRFNGLAEGAVDAAAFHAAAGAQAAQDVDDRLIYDTTTGRLYYDADGVGGVAAVHFATVGTTTHPVLTASDFIVYNILI